MSNTNNNTSKKKSEKKDTSYCKRSADAQHRQQVEKFSKICIPNNKILLLKIEAKTTITITVRFG